MHTKNDIANGNYEYHTFSVIAEEHSPSEKFSQKMN